MSIENDAKKPSYDVLSRLIRELGISADDIFFPEHKLPNTKVEQLIRFIYECDNWDIEVVTATVKALLERKNH